jgi:hypothetical protein
MTPTTVQTVPDHLIPLRVTLFHQRSQEISRILRSITDYKGAIREVMGFFHPNAERLDRGQLLRMIGNVFLTDVIVKWIVKWDRLLHVVDLVVQHDGMVLQNISFLTDVLKHKDSSRHVDPGRINIICRQGQQNRHHIATPGDWKSHHPETRCSNSLWQDRRGDEESRHRGKQRERCTRSAAHLWHQQGIKGSSKWQRNGS